jgi:hypothetical protein
VPFSGPQLPALERAIFERTGEQGAAHAWDRRALPPYLTLGFRVVDEHDRALAFGRDLAELQRTLAPQGPELWARAPRERHERTGLTRWDFDALPASVTLTSAAAASPRTRRWSTPRPRSTYACSSRRGGGRGRDPRRPAPPGPPRPAHHLDQARGPGAGALASGPLVVAGAPATPRRQVVLRALDEAFG